MDFSRSIASTNDRHKRRRRALLQNQVRFFDVDRTQAIIFEVEVNDAVAVPILFRQLPDGVIKEKPLAGTADFGPPITLRVLLGNVSLRRWPSGSFCSTNCRNTCIEITCNWNALMNGRENDLLRKTGTVLIILGVSVWGVYAVLHYILDMNVNGRDFLAFHLAGVVPGALLRRHQSISKLYKRYVKKA